MKIFAADDWGFSPGINRGILALASRGVLRSASLVANAPYLQHGLDELLKARGVRFFLHFNLTAGTPLAPSTTSLTDPAGNFRPHKKLLIEVLRRKVPRHEVSLELKAQLDRLAALNVPIEGVDGHHHVHLLPGISDVVQELLFERGLRTLRIMVDRDHPMSYWLSKWFLLFGNPNCALHLENCWYLRNSDLREVDRLRSKLHRAAGHSILAHPALFDDFTEVRFSDKLAANRVYEFQRLSLLLDTL